MEITAEGIKALYEKHNVEPAASTWRIGKTPHWTTGEGPRVSCCPMSLLACDALAEQSETRTLIGGINLLKKRAKYMYDRRDEIRDVLGLDDNFVTGFVMGFDGCSIQKPETWQAEWHEGFKLGRETRVAIFG